MKPRAIFNDPILDKTFKEKGYAIIDLLDKNTARDLYKRCKSLDAGVDAPFYTSLWSKNTAYRYAVTQLIEKEIGERVQPYFYQYKPLFGDLLIKHPSLTKNFPVHQDWTFVDEHQYTSLYVWCPLINVNYMNGNLQVVEGSHLFLDKIRGANIKVSYEAIKPFIADKYLKSIPLKAGQAIIFNQALLHASPPNRSLRTRIAMGLLMLPTEADIYHYYYEAASNKTYRIEADKEFFMRYSEQSDFKNALAYNNLTINTNFLKQEIQLTSKTVLFNEFEDSIKRKNI